MSAKSAPAKPSGSPVAAAKTAVAPNSKAAAAAPPVTTAKTTAKTTVTPSAKAAPPAPPVASAKPMPTVNAKLPAPLAAKPKLAQRSRLATLPGAAPTRATAMPYPENVRAALARKPAPKAPAPAASMAHAATPPAKAPATAPQTTMAHAATMVPAGPRGAVTLTPAKPTTPVPMGIPVAPGSKLAGTSGKPSSARGISAVAVTGLAVGPGVKGLAPTSAASKSTPPVVAAGKTPAPAAAKMAALAPVEGSASGKAVSPAKTTAVAVAPQHHGLVTQLPKESPTRAPSVSPVTKMPVVATPTPLEDQVAYQYNALGRRDPFNSLLEGEFVGDDQGGDAPPDLGGLKVVGIMWGSEDQFAMVEDVRGNSYVLRRGDKIMNGFVEGLKRDAMIVNITVDGQSQSVTVPITRKGEKSNANR